MAKPIVIIAPELPGGGTVDAVLDAVSRMCHELDHGNNRARVSLYDRLKVIFTNLQHYDDSHSPAAKAFVATLEEYFRILSAYNHMSIIERLLNFRKTSQAFVGVNKQVDELFEMLQLPNNLGAEWETLAEMETKNQLEALESIVGSRQVLDDMRAVKDQQDSIVMLKAEIEKFQTGESELPPQSQQAVTAAFSMLASASRALVEKTPDWFIPESDVTFREKPFARAAFATIHHGTYRRMNVVVKLLLPGDGVLDGLTQRAFLNEVEIWYKFTHPHVIRMFGANHVATRPFIVMEEAPQGNLQEFLMRSSLNVGRRWRLLYEAALGVEFLHRSGIVHAGLKLNDILVSNDGRALISDFGLSQIKTKSKSKSKSMAKRKDGELVGGPLRWMAPEAFEFRPQLPSDVYSFAMTILEAFLGEPPYAWLDDESVRDMIRNGQLPPRPDDMSDDAWQLIQKMTVHDLKDRLTMSEVVEQLRAFADDEEAFEQGRKLEQVRSLVCGTCGEPWDHDWGHCKQCGGDVAKPDHVLVIESDETLRQMISVLTRGTSAQRERAMAALSEYACGDTASQDAVISAGAVPLILKLLDDADKNVRLAALTALTAVAALNEAGQNAFAQDRGFEHFLHAISKDSEDVLERGILALCVAVDSNLRCQAAARSAGALPLLLFLSSHVDGRMKAGADMALKLLQNQITALAEPTDGELSSAAVRLSFGTSTHTTEEQQTRAVTVSVDVGAGEESLLWRALTNGDVGLVLYLARNGANVNIIEGGQPLLHAAMQLRSLKMLQCLVHNGAAIDVKNEIGDTVLHIATATRFVRAVSFLARENADPNVLDAFGRTPLQNCLFATDWISDSDYEAAYSIASSLCAHGATWDSCERNWREAQDQVRRGDESSIILWQVGLGVCVQDWIKQRDGKGVNGRQEIPIEIVKQGEASVATYIANSAKSTAEGEVYRRKICVVGHTTFGKTSLVNSVVSNKSCCAEIDNRTIGIDRVPMMFLETDGEATHQHQVTFWDYAGQSIYQSAHSMFFSKRTLYLLCVDLRVYETMLHPEPASDEGVPLTPTERITMMQEFLSDQVFRWVRLVLMRQPDAHILVVLTKRDQLQHKASEKEIEADFRRRLRTWITGFLGDIETGKFFEKSSDQETLAQLRASLNRIPDSQWITVSALEDKDVLRARQLIEDTIVKTAKERSFRMPDEYVRVLDHIQEIQKATASQPGDRRITSTTIRSDVLTYELTQRIPELDEETCRVILHTLRDLGDILWFESNGPETLRDYVIVDPMIVIDIVRGAVNHKRADEDNAELRDHGRLTHDELKESPLWCDLDDEKHQELLRAFKELLQSYELAYPAGDVMDWDSDLIVPAYRKRNTDFKSESLMTRQSALCLGGVQLDHVACWTYELPNEISDTIFDQLCVRSHSEHFRIRAGPDVVEADYDHDGSHKVKIRIAIERRSLQYDFASVEVAAADRDTCWYFMKWFVLKVQSVVKGYPALKPRCRIFDEAAGIDPRGKAAEGVYKDWKEAVSLGRPTDLPDVSWYNVETPELIVLELQKMELKHTSQFQQIETQVNKIDALMRLIVTSSDRELPALWIFERDEDDPRKAKVKLLSSISGRCWHEGFQITIPPEYWTKNGWLIQNSVNLLSNVADSLIGIDIVNKAMEAAKSAIDSQVSRAQTIHTLIQAMGSPGAAANSSTDRPLQSRQLLRELLRLTGEVVNEEFINLKANLYCAGLKDKYVWASLKEIKELGGEAIPCNTHVFEAPPPSPTASTATTSSGTNPSQLKQHTALVIEAVDGFTSWDHRRMYCAWSLLAHQTPNPLAGGTTPCHVEKGTLPQWTKRFAIECAESVAQLREYELHIAVMRPSRIPFYGDRTLANVTLRLADNVPADSTSAKPIQIVKLALEESTPSQELSITLSITVPDSTVATPGA